MRRQGWLRRIPISAFNRSNWGAFSSLRTKLSVRSPCGFGRRCSARSRFAEAVKWPDIQCTPSLQAPSIDVGAGTPDCRSTIQMQKCWAGSLPMPLGRSPDRLLRSVHAIHANGSRVMSELALRPGSSPQARVATDDAFCVTRREAWVTGFDCGAGVLP